MGKYGIRQYVELFHLLFLDQIGRKLDKRFYALKGGANLRFFLHSIRYSEDMDIDVESVSQHKLRDVVNSIFTSKPFRQILELRGIKIERISEPKQTETTQRWKIGLITESSEAEIPTKIEFSRRGMDGMTVFEPVDTNLIREYQLGVLLVSHYDAKTAYEQKVKALITRNITQARDIFDLHLLLGAGVDASISDIEIRKKLKQAQANAMVIDFNVFKSQVLSFLGHDHREQYDSKDVWEDMVLRVVEALQEAEK